MYIYIRIVFVLYNIDFFLKNQLLTRRFKHVETTNQSLFWDWLEFTSPCCPSAAQEASAGG